MRTIILEQFLKSSLSLITLIYAIQPSLSAQDMGLERDFQQDQKSLCTQTVEVKDGKVDVATVIDLVTVRHKIGTAMSAYVQYGPINYDTAREGFEAVLNNNAASSESRAYAQYRLAEMVYYDELSSK